MTALMKPRIPVMITKRADKPAESNRPAVSRRAGNSIKPARNRAAITAGALVKSSKRDAPAEQNSGQGPRTKVALLLQLLNRPEGASIEDMMRVSQWQQHSVRGFLASTVKKKLGLALVSSKAEGDVRRYRIAPRRGR